MSNHSTPILFSRVPAVVAGFLAVMVAVGSVALQAAGPDAKVTERLRKALPGVQVEDIRESKVPGLYEVHVGTEFGYVTGDGKYLIQGDMIDLETGASITESQRKKMRLEILDEVGEENMITFPSKKPEHVITIFTDIDCGYCRKMHREMERYNEKGISIRYMMYPRSGPQTESYFKAVGVWCADDRRAAMTRAKQGASIARAQCANPVLDHYSTGQRIGVRGTPMMVLEDGSVIPGYVPAEQLIVRLNSKN